MGLKLGRNHISEENMRCAETLVTVADKLDPGLHCYLLVGKSEMALPSISIPAPRKEGTVASSAISQKQEQLALRNAWVPRESPV